MSSHTSSASHTSPTSKPKPKVQADMKLVRVLDLAGKPIDGLTVDITIRNADGSPRYSVAPDPRLRVMKEVIIRSIRDHRKITHKWLFWRWYPDTGILGDCGYSGVRLDFEELPDYWLYVEGGGE